MCVAQVVMAVSDTGVGIPAEQLDRIWGAFNQGSEGMARKFGGEALCVCVRERPACACACACVCMRVHARARVCV